MEFQEDKPIYQQLGERLMDDLEQGYLHNGDRILSVREYAARTRVNANTVMRTYSCLQQEGVIRNQRGIGYFFCDDAKEKVYEMRKAHFYSKEMPYFFSRLHALGINPDSLKQDFINYLNTKL